MKKITVSFLILIFCSNAWAEQGPKIISLQPIVITPWRTEEIAANVSKNVTIIEREEIERASARYVYELIGEKVGIVTANQLDNPKGAVVDIRGFGEASSSNVLVLIDGRRSNQIDLSGVDWGQINVDAIERIEIVRGPGTVLYGDNARGGVINIITKKGESHQPVFIFGADMGSYGYQKEFFNFGESCEFLDYFMNYSHQYTHGYRENNDYFTNDYFGQATLRPTNNAEIDLLLGYHHDHYGMPGALYLNGNPSALNPQGINQIGRRGTTFPNDRGSTEEFYSTVVPKFSLSFSDYDLAVSLFGSFRSRRSKGLNIPEATAWSYSEYETAHHIKSYDFRPKVEFEAKLFGTAMVNKITTGFDYFYAKDQILSGNRISGRDQTEVVKETLGAYLHDNVRLLENMLFNTGVRTEWAEYTFDQKQIAADYQTKDLRETAGELGLGYKYNKSSQIYLNFTRAYRNPNTEEYYQNKFLDTNSGNEYGGLNQDLKHQRSNNIEVGIKDSSLAGLSLNADYYWMETKNEIYYDPSSFANTNYSPRTIRQGIELETHSSFAGDRLKFFLSYLWQQAYFKGGIYANERVPFVPRHKLSSGATVKILDNLGCSFVLTYVGSRFKVSDQKNIAPKLKPYLTLDTRFSYEWKDANLYFAIDNLFDKKYYAYAVTNGTGTAESFYPAPERRYKGGIAIKF